MIVAEVKPFKEIKDMVKGYRKVLVLGCGGCVTVCLSGGKRQVELLASAIGMAGKIEGNETTVIERTIPRQCDPKFIKQIVSTEHDAILSMACGAGVQCITEQLRNIAVLPAMNTKFIGVSDGQGRWFEVCTACGDCILSLTGGICPITRCPKGLLNGPCGGTKNGKCEVSHDIPCAWIMIYERLKDINKLEDMERTIEAKDWSKSQSPRVYTLKG